MLRQIVCKNCGSVVPYNSYYSQTTLAKIMRARSLCFDCAFWELYMENPIPSTYVISGKLYTCTPMEDILRRGPSRRVKGILFAQDIKSKAPVYMKDCKYVTIVPKQYRAKFPDQYRFVSEETYVRLFDRDCKECLAKGCWDRYQCFWYNKKKAEPKEPWNTIPHYHKVGDENCESFINKETMYLTKE